MIDRLLGARYTRDLVGDLAEIAETNRGGSSGGGGIVAFELGVGRGSRG